MLRGLARGARGIFRRWVIGPADEATSRFRARDEAAERPPLIQFWDEAPPADVLKLMSTWKYGPGARWFSYDCFDDGAAREFIRENYDSRTLGAYLQCAVPAMKSDFFRYCYLHARGGVWVDADVGCVRSLYPLFSALERGLLCVRPAQMPGRIRLVNWLLVVKKPGDRLFERIIADCIRNIEERSSNNIHVVTGGGVSTSLYHSQDAHERALFDGFRIVQASNLTSYVSLVDDLAYKTTSRHWTIVQKERSIFSDDVAGDA